MGQNLWNPFCICHLPCASPELLWHFYGPTREKTVWNLFNVIHHSKERSPWSLLLSSLITLHPAPLPCGSDGTLVKLINPSLSRHPAGCSELPPPSQSLELLCFKLLPPKLPKLRTSHQSAGASEGKGVGFRVDIPHKNRGCISISFTWVPEGQRAF